MSAISEEVTKDVAENIPKLDDEDVKDSVTEISGENKDDPTTKIKKSTEDDNITSEIQPSVLTPTMPIISQLQINHSSLPVLLPNLHYGYSVPQPVLPLAEGSEPFTTEEIGDAIYIKIIDRNLLAILQPYVRSEDIYSANPKTSTHELFMILPQLRNCVEQDPQKINNELLGQVPNPSVLSGNQIHSSLKKLVEWLEKEYDLTLKQIDQMTKKILKFMHNHTEKFVVLELQDMNIKLINGISYFIVTGEIIDSNGYEFVNITKTWHIRHFFGLLNVDKLPVVPLQNECAIRDELVKRVKFLKCLPLVLIIYNILENFFVNLANYNPTNYNNFNNFNNTYPKQSNKSDNSPKRKLKEEELYMCSSIFFGFSFMTKKWGQFYVDQVDEIKFDDDAFDNLIMDTNKKDIIIRIDLISGKGGGCIFLLHGPPGAISEYLHRPLYAVSVGELGVTPKELEDKLSEILELARVWNAVILIDEEQRSKNDVNRNALVGIFLRLLEYHQGILFLTTN
ncbi:1524_t:CDS:2, partial [Gigaspora margarita]